MQDTAPLFHAFSSGALSWPSMGTSAIWLGASPGILPPSDFNVLPVLVQGFRPDFLKLEAQGAQVVPELRAEPGSFDLALVSASRHRGENEMNLARAITCVKANGLIVMAGGKADGISSLRKRLAAALPLGGHLSKNHGEVLWFNRSAAADAMAGEALARTPALVEGRFHTAPGMFSHDHIDAGSRLLAQHLPPTVAGETADFCAGWGYLAVCLAERGVRQVDLYEADFASLAAAKANMAALAPAAACAFHWLDLAAEPVAARYDLIVMNPPFHQGRAADPGIGQAMIRAAAKALKAGGQLYMVANRGLPYEPLLKTSFRSAAELAADATFRVWQARR